MKNKLLIILLLITSLFLMTGCSLFKIDLDSDVEYVISEKTEEKKKVINDFYKYIADKDTHNLSAIFSPDLINEFSYYYYEDVDLKNIINDETVSDKIIPVEPVEIICLNDMTNISQYIKDFNFTWYEISEFGFKDGRYTAYVVKGKNKDTGEKVLDLIYLEDAYGEFKVVFSYLFFQDFK